MTVPNRIAMAPMGVEILDDDGHLREPAIRYYEERARGGAGLIITEVSACAYPMGANARRQIASSSDEYLPGLQELAKRVHKHDGKIALQLVHHGKVSRLDAKEGRDILMPSKPQWHGSMTMGNDLSHEEITLMIEASGGGGKIRAADHDDIAWVIEKFASAAERSRRAGFDAAGIGARTSTAARRKTAPVFSAKSSGPSSHAPEATSRCWYGWTPANIGRPTGSPSRKPNRQQSWPSPQARMPFI
jgi:2,4-dienoyl-CoA reductase (NADPH2)